MIPARLVRTVPVETTPEVDDFWEQARRLHPDWQHVTWRDPITPALFPLTANYWQHCKNGAQLAGLVRLEDLWHNGGIYIDSDVQVFRPLDDFLTCSMFAAWEDDDVVPDAVLGAEPRHPAVLACLDLATERLMSRSTRWRDGDGAWATGPGVTTTVLPYADGVVLFEPIRFYPVHYTERDRLAYFKPGPDTYAVHHWHGSWLEGVAR